MNRTRWLLLVFAVCFALNLAFGMTLRLWKTTPPDLAWSLVSAISVVGGVALIWAVVILVARWFRLTSSKAHN